MIAQTTTRTSYRTLPPSPKQTIPICGRIVKMLLLARQGNGWTWVSQIEKSTEDEGAGDGQGAKLWLEGLRNSARAG